MERKWRIRIDSKRPDQSRIWYKGAKIEGVYSASMEIAGADPPEVVLRIHGRNCDVEWLTEEESDALSTESGEQTAGTGEEGD